VIQYCPIQTFVQIRFFLNIARFLASYIACTTQDRHVCRSYQYAIVLTNAMRCTVIDSAKSECIRVFFLSPLFGQLLSFVIHKNGILVGIAPSVSYTESSACVESRATVCGNIVSILRTSDISAILYEERQEAIKLCEELQEAIGVPFRHYSAFFNL